VTRRPAAEPTPPPAADVLPSAPSLGTTFCIATPLTERLDRFLADQLALSRTQAARLIADRRVTAGRQPLRASARLERGVMVTVEFPPDAPPRAYAPHHTDLRFVYEDDQLAVLDKPAGLVVHPAPGHWDDTLLNALVGRGTPLSSGSVEGRPGIVHRLDRDTSGLLLVAKTDLAHRRLARAIERRQVARTYACITWGHLARSPVDIDAPIARHPVERKRMTVRTGGRRAVTHVEVVGRFALVDLLRVRLETGRTHQIRVHLAHVGHPVVGDRDYAFGGSRRVTPSERPAASRLEALAPRQMLHAAELSFHHPVTGVPLTLRSDWPEDVRAALAEAAGDPKLLAERNPLQYLGFAPSDE
jgi:23S rRNA pseudouridine1911/1915/1917 synthase